MVDQLLGRTGNNVRFVLDYAKSVDCVLLLDELDAIAKRRDDATEVGELKRLVTVLLQEIDDWPPERFLVAATNHEALLDPAVWRRFDVVLQMPIPDKPALELAIERFLGPYANELRRWRNALVHVLQGSSFNDIECDLLRARRAAALNERPAEEAVLRAVRGRTATLSRQARADLATL